METNICFVCLQKLPNFLTGNFWDADGPHLNLKFSNFVKNYLGIQDFKVGSSAEFCDNCENLISSVCKLFLKLLSVQLRISSELGKLAELLESAESDDFQGITIKSLAQQLQVQKPVHLSKLRKLLKTKCEQKRKEALPQVFLDRSLVKGYDKLLRGACHEINNTEFESEVFYQSDGIASTENENLFQPDVFSSSESDFSIESDSESTGSSRSISSSKCLGEHSKNKSLEWSPKVIKPIEKGEGEFGCPKCLKVFPTRGKTSAHIYQRHSKKKYRCPECSIIVKRKEILQQHIVAFHKSQNHICQKCEKIFKTGKYLIEHIHRVHPDSDSTVLQHNYPECQKCHRLFRRKHHLEQHASKCIGIATTVLDKKKYSCSETVCSKSFSTRHSLSMHVIDAHKPKLTFSNIAQKFSKLQNGDK
ncbi:unnamed protein product [Orchesella dallaii]|uniref:C2H2-type domain-containing protein n=1 Tax=Orchesella dallaii TaxID=48710 RepID=A0ABP1SB30_9HEXA